MQRESFMIQFFEEYNKELTMVKSITQPPVAQLETNTKPLVSQLQSNMYALRDIAKPIGVSDYELGQALPNDLRSSLPTIEEIEAELK